MIRWRKGSILRKRIIEKKRGSCKGGGVNPQRFLFEKGRGTGFEESLEGGKESKIGAAWGGAFLESSRRGSLSLGKEFEQSEGKQGAIDGRQRRQKRSLRKKGEWVAFPKDLIGKN